MKVTRLGPPLPILNSGLGPNAGSRIPSGGLDLQVLTSNGSNGRYWGENVARITANGSNTLLGPYVNFASGSNIAFAASSNTLTIIGTGTSSGGGGSGGTLTQAYVGYNTVGASYEAATAGRVFAKKVTLANPALLTDIEVYIKITADVDAGQWFAFLWDDNGSGTAPKHLLLSMGVSRNLVLEETSAGPRDPRWFGIPVGRWLTAGDWWIGWQLFDTDLNIAYDTGGSDPYMVPTNPQIGDWGLWTPTNSTRTYSVRANTIR